LENQMARTTDAPRLATIDPEQIAHDVDERLDHYFDWLVTPLSPGLSLRTDRAGPSGLALTAADTCRYAQGGLGGALDWETHEEARDACCQLLSVLWGRPADLHRPSYRNVGPLTEVAGNPSVDENLADMDLADPLSLVLVAAWARLTLSAPLNKAEAAGLTARQLAALAGLDPDAVRRLGRDGEIAFEGLRPALAPPHEARRWLGARGLKGL
jgi:hypothetical protein